MPEVYLTVEQVADRMGIKVDTVYRRRSDKLPMPRAVKFGRKILFRETVVESFMLEHEEAAA